ncbi:MAG: BtpA/SgcQ family protein [Planctomycetota bacterium]
MQRALLPAWEQIPTPIVGMLHLPPLPGAPRHAGDAASIINFVMHDAEALVAGGVDGLLMENYGDTPFTRLRVPAGVVAYMTKLAAEVRRRFNVPLGINVLRNDGCSALAIAAAVGAEFIRVNVLCGARLTDQGLIQGIAYDLLRERRVLGAEAIRIFADINVKHSSPLGPPRALADETRDAIERGGADALIASGASTGHPTDIKELTEIKAVAGHTPVFVGSGVTTDTVRDYGTIVDGFIIGTAFKIDDVSTNPVERARVQDVVQRLRPGGRDV